MSETWDSFARPISTNKNTSAYIYCSTKSQSQNSGVGLYIKTSLGPIPRLELVSDSDEHDTIWVEIENSTKKHFN